MEPERSMTNATLTGVRLWFGSGLQPCKATLQIVLLRLAALHDGQREAGVEPDLADCLAGLRIGRRRRRKSQANGKQATCRHSECNERFHIG